MTELELIVDLHKGTERQGPGSIESTKQALSLVELPSQTPLMAADIGCGSGSSTLHLAEKGMQVHAVDMIPDFLEKLENRSEENGLSDQIRIIQASMEQLPFDQDSFHLILSEGAIYSMGFKKGIQYWRQFLKSGGFICVSDITWLTNKPPQELEDYWRAEYAEISTAEEKIKQLYAQGYSLQGYFNLSETEWLANYYEPLEKEFDSFLERHGHSEEAKNVVNVYKREIQLYREYNHYFGYGYYVARKE